MTTNQQRRYALPCNLWFLGTLFPGTTLKSNPDADKEETNWCEILIKFYISTPDMYIKFWILNNVCFNQNIGMHFTYNEKYHILFIKGDILQETYYLKRINPTWEHPVGH